MAQQKQAIFRTPICRALYPKLTEPDYKFNKGGDFSVRLLLPEETGKELIVTCGKLQRETFEEEFTKQKAKTPNIPEDKIRAKIKMATLPIHQYEDPETGSLGTDFIAHFKMTHSGISKQGKAWTRRPQLFDRQANPVNPKDVLILTGSSMILAYTLSPFYTPAVGAGVSLRLEAAQIFDLKSPRDARYFGFEPTEDTATGADDVPF